jgi:hypothetical protein
MAPHEQQEEPRYMPDMIQPSAVVFDMSRLLRKAMRYAV